MSLLVLIACALAPGLVAFTQGAPVWALAGVLPLMIALAALARDHDRRIEQAAHRLLVAERERARLADSVRRVGRAFGSGLDLPALVQVLAQTACEALDAGRSCVDIAGHEARGGPADTALDALLDRVGGEAAGEEQTTYGHCAAGHHAMAHPLRDGDGVLAVARRARPFTHEERNVLRWLAGQATVSVQNVALHERLLEEAHIDELTGLGNQRVFHQTLARELATSVRTGDPLGLIVLDLDDFKLINDGHGHPVGDRVLAEVGRVLQAAVRSSDTVTRSGGEEFAVVLPRTDLKGAAVAAESVRVAVAGLRVPEACGSRAWIGVTASVGAAATPDCARDASGLYAAADAAMYDAKQRGKDRVGVGAGLLDGSPAPHVVA